MVSTPLGFAPAQQHLPLLFDSGLGVHTEYRGTLVRRSSRPVGDGSTWRGNGYSGSLKGAEARAAATLCRPTWFCSASR